MDLNHRKANLDIYNHILVQVSILKYDRESVQTARVSVSTQLVMFGTSIL